MVISISWKNVWRSKSRSLIIMTAVMLGICGGLLMVGFMRGMTEQRLSAALKTEVSHIQIHNKAYLENDDFNKYIIDSVNLEESIRTDERVKAYSKRIVINSLISTAESGAGVSIIGIDPENEVLVTDVNTKIIDGAYFEGVKRKPIVIGQKLAHKLKAKVRSKVVLQIQDTTGKTFPAAFRVAGIYKTNNTAFDQMTAFVRHSDLVELSGLENNEAHEFAIVLNDRVDIPIFDKELGEAFPSLAVETWKEGDAMLAYMSDAMDQFMGIFLMIILFALFFGIANTMLMAILERRKELGMLMAVGMKRFRVFRMIMYETIFLSLVGAIVGILVASSLIAYFAKYGLNLSLWATGLESVGYDPIVYFQMDTSYLIQTVGMVVFTGIAASILPAIKALKLNPADALRIDN